MWIVSLAKPKQTPVVYQSLQCAKSLTTSGRFSPRLSRKGWQLDLVVVTAAQAAASRKPPCTAAQAAAIARRPQLQPWPSPSTGVPAAATFWTLAPSRQYRRVRWAGRWTLLVLRQGRAAMPVDSRARPLRPGHVVAVSWRHYDALGWRAW